MADLHKKLAMRRKGISGTKKDNEQKGNAPALSLGQPTLADSISSMIPAPPTTTKNDDSDQNDDDDWN